MIENKKEFENLKPEDFEFVQVDERIFDKKFETKPIGYFKDAMLRFSKNRTNVIATIILATLILLAILVPILTSKNYTRLVKDLELLPPRVPLIEKLGVLDGTRYYKDEVVDLSTIDEKTGLGIPSGYNPEFVKKDSLKNYNVVCGDKTVDCVGGTNVIQVSLGRSKAAIIVTDTAAISEGTSELDPKIFLMERSEKPIIVLDVAKFTGKNPAINILVTTDSGATYHTVTTITKAGKHVIDVFDSIETSSQRFQSSVRIEFTGSTVELNKFEFYLGSTENEPLVSDSGYAMSLYRIINDENFYGIYFRRNGKQLHASFKYDIYRSVLSDKIISPMSKTEYNKILEENADVCIPQDDPNKIHPIGKVFPKGCPIKKLIKEVGSAEGPSGNVNTEYEVLVDNGLYLGYEQGEVPYFIFGTDAGGRDYFALLWMGLRTSLIIGLIVAFINITVGVIYGAIEGYYGGTVDLLMERFSEIAGKVPWLVWLGLFVVIFGPGVGTLILILTVTGWLGVASTTRAQFYRYKGREYVLASRTLGAKDMRIIFRHILPNGIGTIITASVLMVPHVIFSESTISYLGYGLGRGSSFNLFGFIPLTGTSLGVLLSEGRLHIVDYPYLVFFPSIIIAILMITFNMFGNALRDAFNPTLRGSE